MTGRRVPWPDVGYGLALAAALSLVLLAVLITVTRADLRANPRDSAVPAGALIATVPVDASRLRPGDLVLFDTGDRTVTRRVLAVEPGTVRTADWLLDPAGTTRLVVTVIPDGADPATWFAATLAVPPLALLVTAAVLAARSRRQRRFAPPDTPLRIMTPR